VSTTVDLRPSGTVASNLHSIGGGAGSQHVANNDNSDSTYTFPTGLGNYAYFDIGTTTLAGNERIEQVRAGVRNRVNVLGKYADYHQRFADPITAIETPAIVQWASDSSIRTDWLSWKTRDPNGIAWTQTLLDRLQLRVAGVSHADSAYEYPRFYELYVRVQIDTRPVVDTLVAGSIDSTRPTVTYRWTDTDGDWQNKRQVKVYSAAQYGAGGFNPDTSAATWDSGIVSASMAAGAIASAIKVGVDLAPGTTYRFYVRGSRDFMGVEDWFSDWANVTFTTSVSLPDVPTLVATADNTLSRVSLAVAAHINALTGQDSSLEATGVGNWVNAANSVVSRVTTDASHGAGSLQLSSSAGGNMSARLAAAGRPATSPGVVWTAVADFRAATVLRSTRVDIEFYDAGGAVIGSATLGTAGNDAVGSYTQRVCLSATAPALTAKVGMILNVLATGAGAEVHRVDRIGLIPGSSTAWGLGGYLPGAAHVIEASDDGGTTWTELDWLEVVVDQLDQADTLYDYSAPRGTARIYRARTRISTPTEVTSLPSATDTETLALPPTGIGSWWLKDLRNPAANFSPLLATLPQSMTEQLDIFRPEGRPYPLVVSGDLTGTDGTMTVQVIGPTQWASLRYFARLQYAFLLQAPDGEQWMVRTAGDRSIERRPSPAQNVIREVSWPYVEVALGEGVT
jgi:hypothetical protein